MVSNTERISFAVLQALGLTHESGYEGMAMSTPWTDATDFDDTGTEYRRRLVVAKNMLRLEEEGRDPADPDDREADNLCIALPKPATVGDLRKVADALGIPLTK